MIKLKYIFFTFWSLLKHLFLVPVKFVWFVISRKKPQICYFTTFDILIEDHDFTLRWEVKNTLWISINPVFKNNNQKGKGSSLKKSLFYFLIKNNPHKSCIVLPADKNIKGYELIVYGYSGKLNFYLPVKVNSFNPLRNFEFIYKTTDYPVIKEIIFISKDYSAIASDISDKTLNPFRSSFNSITDSFLDDSPKLLASDQNSVDKLAKKLDSLFININYDVTNQLGTPFETNDNQSSK